MFKLTGAQAIPEAERSKKEARRGCQRVRGINQNIGIQESDWKTAFRKEDTRHMVKLLEDDMCERLGRAKHTNA
jgi:hypothetical protein